MLTMGTFNIYHFLPLNDCDKLLASYKTVQSVSAESKSVNSVKARIADALGSVLLAVDTFCCLVDMFYADAEWQ